MIPKLNYIKGNVTNPFHKNTVICHIVNNANRMGSGVARALFEKWPAVKSEYHAWANNPNDPLPFVLGNTIFVEVERTFEPNTNDDKEYHRIVVANMVAQHRIKSMGEAKPIRYDALDKCFKEVYEFCKSWDMILSMPRVGTERAGGDWVEIEKLILKNILCETFVYDWDGK